MNCPNVCKSCGAPIIWVKTEKGRRMPLDLIPEEDGTWEFNEATKIAHHVSYPQPSGTYRKSHFATCPHAASHRKEKTK